MALRANRLKAAINLRPKVEAFLVAAFVPLWPISPFRQTVSNLG
jgi:hypothetical protein